MLKSAAYTTYKTTTSSTANAVDVTASGTADTGAVTVQVNKLAQNASATSTAKVSKNGTQISANNTAKLSELQFGTPLTFGAGDKVSFSINGKTFEFTKDTTLQTMINTINTDKTANVTMKYSRLTDQFTITADSGGANSEVVIRNYQGNVFGPNSALKIANGNFTDGRSDAEAVINGVTVKRDSNEFSIDGMNYTLKKVTKGTSEEKVELNIERDYSGTIDSVKKFIEGYNKLYEKLKGLLNEKDNSDSYPPLTDAQKDEMTTEQITAWEKKAKSGVLRHNSDLNILMSNLRNAFITSLGGTDKNAADIGITGAGFFEENAGSLVLNEDKLTEALSSGANDVIDMFTGNSSSTKQGLIYKIKNSITSYTNTVKNSIKTIESKIKSYDTVITGLEGKLEDQADRYYRKFANMETALSKMNAQASYISQMFGGA
jgi:flagellar hook-associated protein 2